jgi:GTP-binding protein
MFTREDIRNIAIIAHVDHGKTTLVDALIRQSGIFRTNQKMEERVMDSNDLEKERGITILSKNMSVTYNDIKINIVDTPGHADFGGEVERVLKMVDGVLLVVDAFEGAMPQTRFVLKKALELNLKPIVVINKIDRPEARPNEVIDEVLDLFIELGADDDQLEFSIVYASAKQGFAKLEIEDEDKDMSPLFETILKEIPAPIGELEDSLQFLATTLDYDDYVGKIAIGKVVRGSMKVNQAAVICNEDTKTNMKITKIYQFDGLKRVEAEEAKVGDLIAVAGVSDLSIGDTICAPDKIEPLDFVKIDEPTLAMTFSVNNSPFAGREGDFVTSRHLRDRLF